MDSVIVDISVEQPARTSTSVYLTQLQYLGYSRARATGGQQS